MPYRVTQYDADTHWAIHSEIYRWKLAALVVAWVMAGRGLDGRTFFTRVEEI